jgi:SAM-dependent methyltransferase
MNEPLQRLSLGCRSCGEPELYSVLSLGRTPLANSLLREDQLDAPERSYPLELAVCSACSLVQITESVPPEEMFSSYLYFSSFSDTMVAHAEEIAGRLIGEHGLGPDSLVIEVASNDGYLLRHYLHRRVPVLGIEPASNIAEVARNTHGIETLNEFFDEAVAARLVAGGRRGDVVHANNVLAHVPDLNGFVQGLSRLVKDDGVVVIEASYVKDFIEECAFDTIYHEHLCYFSLTALDLLFTRHGLQIVDVEHLTIHGGSLRVFARRSGTQSPTARVTQMLMDERNWGVCTLERYASFAARARALRDKLRTLLQSLKQSGKTIAGYGAAAKGATLLNYSGIGPELLDYVVDRSTYKQGLYMPGVRLSILAPEHLLETRPDYVLLLTWNFAREIIAQQGEYLRDGGQFIVPVPEPRVLEHATYARPG